MRRIKGSDVIAANVRRDISVSIGHQLRRVAKGG